MMIMMMIGHDNDDGYDDLGSSAMHTNRQGIGLDRRNKGNLTDEFTLLTAALYAAVENISNLKYFWEYTSKSS